MHIPFIGLNESEPWTIIYPLVIGWPPLAYRHLKWSTDLSWDTDMSLSSFLPRREKEREWSPPLTHPLPRTGFVTFSIPRGLKYIQEIRGYGTGSCSPANINCSNVVMPSTHLEYHKGLGPLSYLSPGHFPHCCQTSSFLKLPTPQTLTVCLFPQSALPCCLSTLHQLCFSPLQSLTQGLRGWSSEERASHHGWSNVADPAHAPFNALSAILKDPDCTECTINKRRNKPRHPPTKSLAQSLWNGQVYHQHLLIYLFIIPLSSQTWEPEAENIKYYTYTTYQISLKSVHKFHQ